MALPGGTRSVPRGLIRTRLRQDATVRVPLPFALMEQPPKREGTVPEQEGMVPGWEGTVPAPASSEGTCQLPEEAISGEEMPAGGQESPAPDGQAAVADVPSSPGVGQPGCAPHLPSDEQPREDAPEKQPMEGGGALPGAPVPCPGAGAVGEPAEPPQARTPSREAEADFYCVKWITWKGERTPVIMQSENGPCPLLAIMNILFLQWKASGGGGREILGDWRGGIGPSFPPGGEGTGMGMVSSLSVLAGEAAAAEGGGHGRGADGAFG